MKLLPSIIKSVINSVISLHVRQIRIENQHTLQSSQIRTPNLNHLQKNGTKDLKMVHGIFRMRSGAKLKTNRRKRCIKGCDSPAMSNPMCRGLAEN